LQSEIKTLSETVKEDRDLGGKNKILVMKALVHAADIGNPTRPF